MVQPLGDEVKYSLSPASCTWYANANVCKSNDTRAHTLAHKIPKTSAVSQGVRCARTQSIHNAVRSRGDLSRMPPLLVWICHQNKFMHDVPIPLQNNMSCGFFAGTHEILVSFMFRTNLPRRSWAKYSTTHLHQRRHLNDYHYSAYFPAHLPPCLYSAAKGISGQWSND